MAQDFEGDISASDSQDDELIVNSSGLSVQAVPVGPIANSINQTTSFQFSLPPRILSFDSLPSSFPKNQAGTNDGAGNNSPDSDSSNDKEESTHSSAYKGVERIRARREKNRISAAASRKRKKQFVENLQKQVAKLSQDNGNYQMQIRELHQMFLDEKMKSSKLEKDLLKLIIENAEFRQRLREYEGVSVSFEQPSANPITLEPLTNSLPIMYSNLLNSQCYT